MKKENTKNVEFLLLKSKYFVIMKIELIKEKKLWKKNVLTSE